MDALPALARFWPWLAIPAAAYLLLLFWLYHTQERLLYLPELPGRAVNITPASLGLTFEPVTLTTEDGETLGAWYLPADEARGTVLFFHGNAGNRGHRLDTLRLLHELGLATLIFDYRGYGDSSGRPSEQGTARDARAAWAYLTETRGIRPGAIILFGRSLGGAVAAKLASEVRPRALILESTFTSVPDLGAEHYPWLPVRWLSRLRYPTLGLLPRIDAPVLVAHSGEDEIVPFHHGQALYAAAPEPKAFLTLTGDHNGGFLTSGRHYRDGIAAFLDGHPPR